MRAVRPIAYVLCAFLTNGAFSQTVTDGREILGRFELRFAELDSLLHPSRDVATDLSGDRRVPAPGSVAVSADVIDQALDRRVEAEIKEFKSRTGLQITGQTYYRLDEGLGMDEDDAVSQYNAKVQAELRWSPLQSSIFRRKGTVNEIRLKGELDRLAYEKNRLGMSVVRQKELFRSRYDSLLCGILRHRIDNLALLSDAHDYLLHNENISSDGLLEILNEKAEAERKLMSVGGNRYPQARDLSCPAVRLVMVDSARLLQHICDRQIDLKELGLRMALLEQREANTDYWNNVDIAPFVRYSYYTRTALPNSSNVDAGISFRLLLSAESKRQRQSIRAERGLLGAEHDRLLARVYDEVRFILDGIGRLNLSIEGEYRRSRELLHYLAVRKEAYANRIGEYDRLARMKEYNSYLMCLEKMAEFQYQRDCQIADLARYLTDEPVETFCYEEKVMD